MKIKEKKEKKGNGGKLKQQITIYDGREMNK